MTVVGTRVAVGSSRGRVDLTTVETVLAVKGGSTVGVTDGRGVGGSVGEAVGITVGRGVGKTVG